MLGAPTLALKTSLSFQRFRSQTMTTRSSVAQLPERSLYEVLRVKQNASHVEIKTAYRTLAKLYHPDATSRFMDSSIASPQDGRDFIEIRNAYATLSDPDARAVYDSKLKVNSQRRWNTSGGYRSPGRGDFIPPGGGKRTSVGELTMIIYKFFA